MYKYLVKLALLRRAWRCANSLRRGGIQIAIEMEQRDGMAIRIKTLLRRECPGVPARRTDTKFIKIRIRRTVTCIHGADLYWQFQLIHLERLIVGMVVTPHTSIRRQLAINVNRH